MKSQRAQFSRYECTHIWTKGEVCAPWNRLKPSSKRFVLTVPRWYFFCGPFVFLCLVFVLLSGLFIAALWSPEGKWRTSWLSFVILLWFCYFPISYPGTCVVLDCIDSWSMLSFLLYFKFIFLISQPKHMLWVLKRTVSVRQFFWAPKTYVLLKDKKRRLKLAYLDICLS